MAELHWPFPPSEALRGITFTGRSATYTNADTLYPSWAAEENLYTSYTDGNWERPITDVQAMDCSSGGSLVCNGVWYYGTYTRDETRSRANGGYPRGCTGDYRKEASNGRAAHGGAELPILSRCLDGETGVGGW